MADDMRVVTARYENDEGVETEFSAQLNLNATMDLIEFFASADGNDEYERGDFSS